MINHSYSFEATLAASEKSRWRVEDLIGPGKSLDFGRPFLPESLAQTDELSFLTEAEKMTLNQIRGHTYLNVFGLVEEFILPFVLDHARPHLHGDDHRIRAMLGFASEEAKHIHLFKCFAKEFGRGFGHRCEVIGPPREIAQAVLSHHPLAVALVILQIEWMTQAHYVQSVRNDQALDPQFASLLKHHWMEEAQHAKLDTLVADSIAEACSPEEIDRAITDYGKIGALLDGGLQKQAELDVAGFLRATSGSFTPEECDQIEFVQKQATRFTFLGSGMGHPNFLSAIGDIRPAARQAIESMIPAYC